MCNAQIKLYDHAIDSNEPKYPYSKILDFRAHWASLGMFISHSTAMLEKKTHHNNDTYGMIPRTCWHLEHC